MIAPSTSTVKLLPDWIFILPVSEIVLLEIVKSPIVAVVKVLFVSVSVPSSVANDPSDNAELNCAVVPDTVFEPNAIVLFVSVLDVKLNKYRMCLL